jgi:hypothetical protein
MTECIDIGATLSVKTQLRSYGTLSISEANVCGSDLFIHGYVQIYESASILNEGARIFY